ncbi:protein DETOXIFICATION 52 [Ricinus communis]|uniref:Protein DETOXIFICATION n=1 Tax=Ricinus communis TaxID=3988 RepID=B9RKH9_RICCO|nr:protein DETOXIFICATION 52 [Ricinus communis]EEF48177.1 multidrug resistance pump, putative [Ricinus communis]|eukprot:XP_002514223.1 protein DETOXIFICATION 52 [Ricinus communis]
MCNPDTSASYVVIEKPSESGHLYLNLLSLPTTIKDLKNVTIKAPPPQEIYPSVSEIISETKSLFKLAFPIVLTALILYSRSIVSMLFLGHLGDLELAAGSLAIAFANITGYSVLSGLALGMEPLCSQAFGAQRPKLLSVTLHRCVIFLLVSSIPIFLLWINMSKILVYLHQDPNITSLAHTYLLFSLPDLLTNSFIHPIRIYLRAQGITHPLTLASLAGTILHLPINLLLVNHLKLGVAGIAAAAAASNFFVLLSLVSYVWASGLYEPTWTKPSRECFTGWKPLIQLAAPSCVSVCLEWWWYEIMIILCGLLVNPKSTVASMGILIQTTSLIYIFPSSLGFAVSTRVGNELGANRPHKAKLSTVVAVFISAVIGVIASMFASGMKDKWGQMFTSDAEILRLTTAALPILGLCELGNCPQTVGCGVLRGSARPSSAANVNLGAFYLVGMPVAIGLGFWVGVGFCGLWLGLLSAQVCCAGLMFYVVGSTDWDLEAKRAQLLTHNDYDNNRILVGQSEGEKEQRLICVMEA